MGTKKRRTSLPKRNDGAGEPPPVGPPSEFRNSGEDAWYSVNLVLQGETLLVKYREFADPDEEFHAGDFTTSDKVSAFRRRFRPLSQQLEASDCWMVQQGMRVCALRVFAEDDRRYYDAIVEAVKHEEHTTVNGVEKCPCSFVLSWLHGPEAGTLTSALVEDLCPVQSCAQLDPRLACFLEIAKWKHGITVPSSKLSSEDDKCNQESLAPSSKHKDLRATLKSQSATKIGSALLDDEGYFEYERNEDVDLGGGDGVRVLTDVKRTDGNYPFMVGKEEGLACVDLEKRKYSHTSLVEEKVSSQDGKNDHYSGAIDRLMEDVSYMDLKQRDDPRTDVVHSNARYFILVENLEKDISPSTIVNFVRDATSVEIEAFVFLSLSSEPYTHGALVVDSPEKLEKLCDFVTKQDQMIISSKGRPWIVSTPAAPDFVRPSFWCLEPDLKNTSPPSTDKELRIVKLGSEEYRKAEKLKELYQEFTKHQEQMFKRLALEEENIFNSSNHSFSPN